MPVASSIVTLAKNLIGDDFTTDVTNAVPEILEVAIRDVIDIVPENLLLKYTTLSFSVDDTNGKKSGITSNSSTQSTKNIKILRVKRDVFECKEIPYSYKQQAEDDSSMYLATKYSPVWYVDNEAVDPDVQILPEPSDTESARVDFIKYPHGNNSAYYNENYDVVFNKIGLPLEALNLVLYKYAANIIDCRISNAIQEDEDTEMLQMLSAQRQAYSDILKFEISKLTKVVE